MTLALLTFFACSTPEPTATPAPAAEAPAAPAPAAEPAQAAVALGEPFTATDVVPVDTLVSQATTYDGKPVIVEAAIKEVCQKKGCWHTLATANPEVAVMVKDKEYKIFLPKDAAGKKVHVKGTFAIATIPEDEAKHYAEDAGKDPATVTGPQKTFAIDVDAVQFVAS